MVMKKQSEMGSNEEAQISFLLSKVFHVVPSSYIKLRSYLNIHLSNVAEQQNLNPPKVFKNRNKSCPHCYSEWSTDTSSFKLLPTKKSKFLRTQNKKKIGEVKELRNTLVLKCNVCTNKSLFSLVKKHPVKKILKEETAKSFKKKKKKKDKTCGLFVHLIKDNNSVSVSKNEKRSESMKKNKNPVMPFKNSQGNVKSPKNGSTSSNKSNSVCNKNKKLNPFALQSQGKFSRKKNKKLQGLKNAIKAQKGVNVVKKTLKDFLNVI